MNLNVAKEQKAEIVESLQRFAAEELDVEWSEVRAGFSLVPKLCLGMRIG